MKKILAMVFTMLITLTVVNTAVLASETKNVAVKGNVSTFENGESVFYPQIVHNYTKTVSKSYSSYPVPESISYTEYYMGSWFSGILYLKSVSRVGKNWNATYSGDLAGTI